MTSDNPMSSSKNFQLKGSMVTLTVLELIHFHPDEFAVALADRVNQAPLFFQNMPLLISLEKTIDINIDFVTLKQICIDNGLVPIAIRGGNETLQNQAMTAALPRILASGDSGASDSEIQPAPSSSITQVEVKEATQQAAPPQVMHRPSKFVDQPIRSGQRVYAPGSDLVIRAPVSAGAEVLADGHIHVYGPLRGRALAGVNGDTTAKVFCHSLEAELISVAGYYKTSEDFRQPYWKQSTCAFLDNERLHIESL